jgi:hypothetical protein
MTSSVIQQQPRRPQLSDSIHHLDEMIDDLATAIPGAVAESVCEVLSSGFGDAIREVVREAVKECVSAAVLEALAATAAGTLPTTPIPPSQSPPSSGTLRKAWMSVRGLLGRLRSWCARRAAPVLTRLAISWLIVKLVGGATSRSPRTMLTTSLTGAAAGMTAYAVGPLGAAIMLGVAVSGFAAAVSWVAPLVSTTLPIRNEGPARAL